MSNKKFTAGGRLSVNPWVTPKKVEWVADRLSEARAGNKVSEARLLEALTTSEAPFALSHLANLQFLPNYDEAERTWKQIAGVREVPDLKPATLFSLNRSWTNDADGEEPSSVLGGKDPRFGAPDIPEGTAYPYAYISGEVSQGAGVRKTGFKTDWTLESRINDGLGVLEALPSEMLEVALDTEEADVYGALTTQGTGAGSQLAGGLIPEGITVPANAAFSREALIRAIIELSERRVNGRLVGSSRNGYNLIVPVGQKIFVEFVLNNVRLDSQQDGLASYAITGYNPLANVSVVESEHVTGTEWFVLPKPGGLRRPVLERLELRGYKTPQLFVDNHVGQRLGGGQADVWEGSFDADVITLKLRMFGGGVVWDGGAGVLYSNGTGV